MTLALKCTKPSSCDWLIKADQTPALSRDARASVDLLLSKVSSGSTPLSILDIKVSGPLSSAHPCPRSSHHASPLQASQGPQRPRGCLPPSLSLEVCPLGWKDCGRGVEGASAAQAEEASVAIRARGQMDLERKTRRRQIRKQRPKWKAEMEENKKKNEERKREKGWIRWRSLPRLFIFVRD